MLIQTPVAPRRSIDLSTIGREPYRLFFLLGTVAGMVGVALWPLHFLGFAANYPGTVHGKIMAYGFFGGFIFGFLGTAMPRMLSANALGLPRVLLLASLHVLMLGSFAMANTVWGDALFLVLLVCFTLSLAVRAMNRKDTPPPGFVLVGLAFLNAGVGAIIGVAQHRVELNPVWLNLQRLLAYQGFVLLPILGIGPFILPRFFGMQSTHDFPELLKPNANWLRKASLAAAVGLVIVGSFVLEAFGYFRWAYAIRFAATAGYVFLEMPFRRAPKASGPFGAAIRAAFAMIIGGFLLVALFPVYRVALLHLTLVGGFALITFTVATRVVFGHSGNLPRLAGSNRWVWWAVACMFAGMATRISGDFWPEIMATHYSYGAVLWMVGVVWWAIRVLPLLRRADEED